MIRCLSLASTSVLRSSAKTRCAAPSGSCAKWLMQRYELYLVTFEAIARMKISIHFAESLRTTWCAAKSRPSSTASVHVEPEPAPYAGVGHGQLLGKTQLLRLHDSNSEGFGVGELEHKYSHLAFHEPVDSAADSPVSATSVRRPGLFRV